MATNKNHFEIECNVKDYVIRFTENRIIFDRINKIYTYEEVMKVNLKKSIIKRCFIDNKPIDIRKYKTLLLYIYELINDKNIIQTYTSINIKDYEKNDNGFDYYPKLQLSIQGTEAKKCFSEIVNMLHVIKKHIYIEIQLQDNNVICFENYNK
jgi:hypothetical protein